MYVVRIESRLKTTRTTVGGSIISILKKKKEKEREGRSKESDVSRVCKTALRGNFVWLIT